MPGLLGKKIGMTSVFSAEGKNVPCTVIEVGPCVVTQVKTVEVDGYEAVQVGFADKKEKHTTKPEMGHFKKAGVTPKRHLAEFKGFGEAYKAGDVITVDLFQDAEYVDVIGTSKGTGRSPRIRRSRTDHARSTQSFACSRFGRSLFLPCKGFQRNPYGRSDR